MHAHRLQTLTKRRVNDNLKEARDAYREYSQGSPAHSLSNGEEVYSVRKTARSSFKGILVRGRTKVLYCITICHIGLKHSIEKDYNEGAPNDDLNADDIAYASCRYIWCNILE